MKEHIRQWLQGQPIIFVENVNNWEAHYNGTVVQDPDIGFVVKFIRHGELGALMRAVPELKEQLKAVLDWTQRYFEARLDIAHGADVQPVLERILDEFNIQETLPGPLMTVRLYTECTVNGPWLIQDGQHVTQEYLVQGEPRVALESDVICAEVLDRIRIAIRNIKQH